MCSNYIERGKMFKFVFDLLTEPLGLPIEWYKEWIILGIIEAVAFSHAFDDVRGLYRSNIISGGMQGSFFHWIIRTFYCIVLWAIAYGVIWVGKIVIEHKILVGVILGIILLIVLVVYIWKWYRQREW